MFYLSVAVKLTIGFICLLLYLNISGRTQLAPMSATDQIGNYVLGAIIGGIIYNPGVSVLQFIAVISMWSLLMILTRIIKTRNLDAKGIIDGKPVLLVDHEKILTDNFRLVNLSVPDFLLKLRQNSVHNLAELELVWIEPNGQLTIQKKGETPISLALIEDGNINRFNLDKAFRDEDWLMAELGKQGIQDLSEVFCAEWYSNVLTVYRYNPQVEEKENDGAEQAK
ncbi:DUF421 domain-containing protein [Breznakiella homolactica]|uniref:DUF421 domain-containing protein n=1 Tax=Breznakiella homolactica TaxID=2798577 RepID=A0A7T7XL17_9SPIR|nr:DUF421 domain-containing protein [Breznakiella homolactica]QQO08349.1 DUF421 domain-containing protein [Breznakiella homolactica]